MAHPHELTDHAVGVTGAILRDGGAVVAGSAATASWMGWFDEHSAGLIAISALAGASCSVTGFVLTYLRSRAIHRLRIDKLRTLDFDQLNKRKKSTSSSD